MYCVCGSLNDQSIVCLFIGLIIYGNCSMVLLLQEENDRIITAASNGDIDTLVSMSNEGIDMATAHDSVSIYSDVNMFSDKVTVYSI